MSFNLKRALGEGMTGAPVPFGADNFDEGIENTGDQLAEQSIVNDEISLRAFLDDMQQRFGPQAEEKARITFQQINPNLTNNVIDALSRFFQEASDEATKSQLVSMMLKEMEVFEIPIQRKEGPKVDLTQGLDQSPNQGPGQEGMFASVLETNDIIKKLAKECVSKEIKKTSKGCFNLKTAQHKSFENTFMYGPGEKQIDPFLRQPVSDWHIIERNKGWGQDIGGIWNIDYETLWRENIMDKYSRPYRDKDGNWVGGYIQKRFEVDKNIPEANNYQLKPGQRRKPRLPEYGSTESRLQDARSKGTIEGAPEVDRSKPYNWKEAQSKKKKIAFLPSVKKEKDPFEIREPRLMDEPPPAQVEKECLNCGGDVGDKDFMCPNCGERKFRYGKPHERKPNDPGKEFNDLSTNNDRFMPTRFPIISQTYNYKRIKEAKESDKSKKEEERASDTFLSDEVKMCPDMGEFNKRRNKRKNNRKNNRIVDNIGQVHITCEDLCIDG